LADRYDSPASPDTYSFDRYLFPAVPTPKEFVTDVHPSRILAAYDQPPDAITCRDASLNFNDEIHAEFYPDAAPNRFCDVARYERRLPPRPRAHDEPFVALVIAMLAIRMRVISMRGRYCNLTVPRQSSANVYTRGRTEWKAPNDTTLPWTFSTLK
jgi:hypothetical protein